MQDKIYCGIIQDKTHYTVLINFVTEDSKYRNLDLLVVFNKECHYKTPVTVHGVFY